MEERIQHKLDELFMEKYKGLFKAFGLSYIKKHDSITYQKLTDELRSEANTIIEKEEEIKNKKQKDEIEQQKIKRNNLQIAFDKRQREKKEEEELEQYTLLQNTDNPNMPLTMKDIRVVPGFYYDHYRRALEELNVDILKRIVRETYPHKFS